MVEVDVVGRGHGNQWAWDELRRRGILRTSLRGKESWDVREEKCCE